MKTKSLLRLYHLWEVRVGTVIADVADDGDMIFEVSILDFE